jgi:type III secretory pathway component EscV
VPARQRLVFLAVAVVIAVVAVVLLTRSDDSGSSTPAAARKAASGSGGSAAGSSTRAKAAATPVPVLTGAKVTSIKVQQGQRVRFAVRSPRRQEVHVHGYDLMRDAAPGAPARFSFKATITGRFDIEFEEAGKQIGELEVDPG